MKGLERAFWMALLIIIIGISWHYFKPMIVLPRLAQLAQSCNIKEVRKQIDNISISEQSKHKIALEFWSCVQAQQGVMEQFFIEVPPNFLR